MNGLEIIQQNWSLFIIFIKIGGIISGVIASLVFAAPQLPKLKKYARPRDFEMGWDKLLITHELNQNNDGFSEVIEFIENNEEVKEMIANDNYILDGMGFSMEDYIEEIRIYTIPRSFAEHILICYDENTGGPMAEPKYTENHRYKKLNTDASGQDWRWGPPLSAIEHSATIMISENVQRWMAYGGVMLLISVILQLTAFFVG